MINGSSSCHMHAKQLKSWPQKSKYPQLGTAKLDPHTFYNKGKELWTHLF